MLTPTPWLTLNAETEDQQTASTEKKQEQYEKKFERYLEMMKDDDVQFNFRNAVRRIIKERRKYIPYLENNLDNKDQQIVFGCQYILSNTEGW